MLVYQRVPTKNVKKKNRPAKVQASSRPTSKEVKQAWAGPGPGPPQLFQWWRNDEETWYEYEEFQDVHDLIFGFTHGVNQGRLMVQVQCWHRFGMFLCSEYQENKVQQNIHRDPSVGHSQEIIEICWHLSASRHCKIESSASPVGRVEAWSPPPVVFLAGWNSSAMAEVYRLQIGGVYPLVN